MLRIAHRLHVPLRHVDEAYSLDDFFDEIAAFDFLSDVDRPPQPPPKRRGMSIGRFSF